MLRSPATSRSVLTVLDGETLLFDEIRTMYGSGGKVDSHGTVKINESA